MPQEGNLRCFRQLFPLIGNLMATLFLPGSPGKFFKRLLDPLSVAFEHFYLLSGIREVRCHPLCVIIRCQKNDIPFFIRKMFSESAPESLRNRIGGSHFHGHLTLKRSVRFACGFPDGKNHCETERTSYCVSDCFTNTIEHCSLTSWAIISLQSPST